MKISVSDLKKVIKWVDVNSKDTDLNIFIQDSKMIIRCNDKYSVAAEMTLFDSSGSSPLMAKIKKEENLT